jgi:hypothetical protein
MALLAVAVLAVVSACGSGDADPSATGTSPAGSAPASSPPSTSATASTAPSSTSSAVPSPSAGAGGTAASTAAGTPDGTPTAPGAGTPPSGGTGALWRPEQGTSWQYQLASTLDLTVDAAVYDVDWQDTSADQVAQLHAAGRRVICYVNAGAYEDWRPDARDYPEEVLGEPLDGWPGERWLDVRRTDLLLPLLSARVDVCQSKGFDAVEFDNVDGWSNETGFPLTAEDQLAFNTAIAGLAHARGMSVGLKNDVDQVDQLASVYDFAVNEECLAYDECDAYRDFLASGKAVLHVEYEKTTARKCAGVTQMGMSTILKSVDLGADLRHC